MNASWLTFLLASLILAATPGPGVLFVVARTLSQGRSAGLASVAGVALGNLAMALAASLGLAALFALSSLAFLVVKYLGAAYLVWLGIRAWNSEFVASALAAERPSAGWQVFREGVVVAMLNPKTALFFGAFLPQFIDPAGSAIVQSAAYGAGFVAIAALTDSLYVLAAHGVSGLLGGPGRSQRLTQRISALVYVGLGLLTALSGAGSPGADLPGSGANGNRVPAP